MTEKQETTFRAWLARMNDNQSIIGDLARYIASKQDWAGVANNRGAILAYLDAQGASRATLSAFSRAWASYELAKKRAQDAQATEWTSEEVADHDRWYAQHDAQATSLHVITTPAYEPCQQCGGGSPGENQQWTIPGIGQGVLCRSCLKMVVSQINSALGGQGE